MNGFNPTSIYFDDLLTFDIDNDYFEQMVDKVHSKKTSVKYNYNRRVSFLDVFFFFFF